MGKRMFLRLALLLMLVGALAILMVLPGPALAMGGSGTQEDPYIIWDVDDLQDMDLDLTAYYELGNDIDASATVDWNGELGFDPVGKVTPNYFDGYFDGKGFTISELFINRPTEDFVGLFGNVYTAAVLQNVGIVNCDITGQDMTGALAGNNYAVLIQNCYSTGNVTGGGCTGGLLGQNYADEVTRCFSTCTVTGVSSVGCTSEGFGGLIGTNNGDDVNLCYATGNVTVEATQNEVGGFAGYNRCLVENCYVRGNVSGGNEWAGGFVGFSRDKDITNCYSTGSASGASNVGGFCGELLSASIIHSFWDTETSGMETSDGGTGETTVNMKTESTFTSVGWDFIIIWAIDLTQAINDGYPFFGSLGEHPDVDEPISLLAIPISSAQINLTWDKQDGTEKTGLYYKIGGFPSSRDDGAQIYFGAAESFNHKGLTAGTTYYYKAWGYDDDTAMWSMDWDRDFATTLLGDPSGPQAPPMPEEWFQNPSCEAYGSVPGYALLIDLSDSMGMPFGTMCLISTVFLVVGASAAGLVLGGTMIGLAAMAVGILAASIAGLLPMWFLLVALVLGISLAFAWTRA